ncbi:hypothetical protein NLJ89_g3374 [Agrocybe chaxingu]|uniref:Hydrophobin n=1 Tax=Agrocybe chaxingu TaxID=84603 RepID=A0A9W8MYD1_9AGAR|nr:hypothetical protein NLJ89_g3374 [Agrocybe chaxingu]
MQFKLFTAALAATASLAAATAIPAAANQCNTGPIQCCNQTGTAKDTAIAKILGLLGVVVGDITAIVGVNCNPITVIGAGGNSCTAQPVCCTNNSFNGLIALGCIPININL